MQTIVQKLEAVESALRRWHTRLTIASNKVAKLDRQRRRLQGQMGPVGLTELIGPPVVKKPEPTPAPAAPAIETDHVAEVDLPDFLDRRNVAIAEQMTAARKAAEAEARRQMPLSGRAAIDATRPKKRKSK